MSDVNSINLLIYTSKVEVLLSNGELIHNGDFIVCLHGKMFTKPKDQKDSFHREIPAILNKYLENETLFVRQY